MIMKGYNDRIRWSDVWQCSPEMRCEALCPMFEREWNKVLKEETKRQRRFELRHQYH